MKKCPQCGGRAKKTKVHFRVITGWKDEKYVGWRFYCKACEYSWEKRKGRLIPSDTSLPD